MKNIGKYHGIACYECSDKEYKEVYRNNEDNGRQIFIIDGVMVKNNVIIGHYNGSFVTDVYDGVPYIVEKKATVPQKMETAVTEPTGITDIVYSDYTTAVDNFFKTLVDPVVEPVC